MSNLLDYVRQVPPERTFLISKQSVYTFASIIELSVDFASRYSFLENKSCAIISNDRLSLALYLPAIDNLCNRVFLQPSDIGGNEDFFYSSANIEYVVELDSCMVVSVTHLQEYNGKADTQSRDYLLATSGTTGTPKIASYSLASLTSTAKKDVSRGCEFVWGLTYDINRFAGLQVYLQAIASGSTLVIPTESSNISTLVSLFSEHSVNCLSATPSFWKKVLMVPNHKNLALKRITLGGEISTQSVLNNLVKSFSEALIVHIYASTEAGVGFVVKDKLEGFPSSYLNHGGYDGTDLKIINGILWIKSSKGCSGFIKSTLEYDDEGYICTGDIVEEVGKRIIFLGRDSGSINIGGNKVMPEKIEAVLEQHPMVELARVYSKKNPLLGALVACELSIHHDAEQLTAKDLKRNIVSFCRDKLNTWEIPAFVKKVDAIDINTTGKKARKNK
ncbi:AMP-binding protein [Vibrio breoganii]|uniref:AMP-binding protein n=1 Tax=Vibrio breoganii TaxID=553239 RepID=UPI0021C297AB|nr:class I adenylate-forming enzyme family protein [Vibrio breoganii]MDN3715939.1 class I adenylate-forming enzyme family protein [Vibrio breoganii]